MLDADTFFKFNEDRAKTGYKSAWLVKMPGRDKYSLIGLTEQVPYPFGDTETFDVNVLQSEFIGKIKGKTSMDAVDVPVFHHRDNAYRFNKLKDLTLEFMSINAEFVGYKYTGTIAYKPDTTEADADKATVTLTPLSGSETPIYDARDLIEDTVCLSGVIPETIPVNTKGEGVIDFAVRQTGTPTFSIVKISGENNTEEEMSNNTNYTVSGSKITFLTQGLMAITISLTGCAPWVTTVYVK